MLGMAGMPGFDALAHAMTTIATGGYSTRIYLLQFYSWLIEIITGHDHRPLPLPIT